MRGRKIGLRVAVLPAKSSNPAPDPLFVLQGGPGQAATDLAEFYTSVFAKVRRDRDIVLVDQRGTGSSNPLDCNLYGDSKDLQRLLGDSYTLEAVKACRSQLEQRANLTLYSTPVAMDDLDEVRASLGYERINLYGTSYGTAAAQVYIRRHPNRVRSVILKGVVALTPSWTHDYARNSQQALDRLFDLCAADGACRAAFPELRREFQAVLGRLEAAPVRVEVPHPVTDKPVEVELSRDIITETIRTGLAAPVFASQIPMAIHRAFENDFTLLARAAVLLRRQLAEELNWGMHLSVMCSEGIAGLTLRDVAREAQGTFVGDKRISELIKACEVWPRSALPPDYWTPTRSEIPVLLVSGWLDPSTPPNNGEAVARQLPNSRHVIIRHGGHSFNNLRGCVENIIADFISNGSSVGLDSSCVERIPMPPFTVPQLTKKPENAPATSADEAGLQKFAGTYVASSLPIEITVEVSADQLKATVPGRPAYTLIPVSPTRFRVDGAPPDYSVQFEIERGRVKSLVLEQGMKPSITFFPKN